MLHTDRKKWLTAPRRKKILGESALTYEMQYIKSPNNYNTTVKDRQQNDMHGRMTFGETHPSVCL